MMADYQKNKVVKSSNVGNYTELGSVVRVLDFVADRPESEICKVDTFIPADLKRGEFFMQYAVKNATLVIKPSTLEKIGEESKVVSELIALNAKDFQEAHDLLLQAMGAYHHYQMLNDPEEQRRLKAVLSRAKPDL